MKTDDILSATVEEYLETIYNMRMEDEIVIGARLAERFRVSAPTVTEMLKRLVRDGYVEMDAKRRVTLTESGNIAAEAVLRRHRLTERFLADMLGMQWHEVHEEAERLEHFISGAVEERVMTSLNHPTTCPHGNPIPGAVPNARTYLKDSHAVRLSTVSNGTRVKVLCVSEVVEDEEALIMYMHQKRLTPGTKVTMLAQVSETGKPDDEVKLLVGDDQTITISKAAASKLWVVLI
jgi:DtxR family Mn-dependent transcriptional regulator